jgi:rubrerythrin
MDFSDLNSILDFALSLEEEAADFYRTVSKAEAQDGKQQLFLQFAEEEMRHYRLLLDLKKGEADKTVDNYQYTWITDIKRSNFIADQIYQPGMSYRDILLLAAKREEKALAMYNLFLGKASDTTAAKVFKVLCQEEAKHKLTLETMLDAYMAEMGD